jgi:hypothetical protein
MRVFVLLTTLIFLGGCKEDESKPYLEFVGGGFVFNYRNAEAFYGFVAKPVRAMPEGAMIEVSFDVPGFPEKYVIREPARAGQLQYMFRTPPLRGIQKHHDYKAVMRVIDGRNNAELAQYSKTFRSDVDQASLPDKPLVIGPGYTPNPELPPPGQN